MDIYAIGFEEMVELNAGNIVNARWVIQSTQSTCLAENYLFEVICYLKFWCVQCSSVPGNSKSCENLSKSMCCWYTVMYQIVICIKEGFLPYC